MNLTRILRDKLWRLQHTKQGDDGSEQNVTENLHPELDRFGFDLTNLEREHAHEFRNFLVDKFTSGGFSFLHLRNFVAGLNPEPVLVTDSEGGLLGELKRQMSEWGSGIDKLRDQVFSASTGGSPSERDDHAANWEKQLRPHVRRVHEELRRWVGTRRSLLALLHRFKERCEWHDRDRLREIARLSKRPEDALTAEFARWLFDQGLSPLTRPLAGGLQPDLLDPSRLYVEAKRYRDGKSARRLIVQGAHELYDAVLRLKGTKYEVTEAFYVVFREAGPQCKLPAEVPGDGWVTLPIVIDIAPLTESGSRQKHQPISVSADELGPRDSDEPVTVEKRKRKKRDTR